MKYLLLLAISFVFFMTGAIYGEFKTKKEIATKVAQQVSKAIVTYASRPVDSLKTHTVIHRCSDLTHETCDGTCECDGMLCDDSGYMHDYQLEYHMDTLWVFDDAKLVGKHINTDTTMYRHGGWLDSLIFKDNL